MQSGKEANTPTASTIRPPDSGPEFHPRTTKCGDALNPRTRLGTLAQTAEHRVWTAECNPVHPSRRISLVRADCRQGDSQSSPCRLSSGNSRDETRTRNYFAKIPDG